MSKTEVDNQRDTSFSKFIISFRRVCGRWRLHGRQSAVVSTANVSTCQLPPTLEVGIVWRGRRQQRRSYRRVPRWRTRRRRRRRRWRQRAAKDDTDWTHDHTSTDRWWSSCHCLTPCNWRNLFFFFFIISIFHPSIRLYSSNNKQFKMQMDMQ